MTADGEKADGLSPAHSTQQPAVASPVVPPLPIARLQAPSGDGERLIFPALESLPTMAEQNRLARDRWTATIFGQPLVDLAQEARRQMLQAAIEYTRQYRDISPPSAEQAAHAPLFIGGHQPQLFHPGVWLKNFVLDELSGRSGGIAVNLVVDSDAIKSASLPVLTGSVEHPERVQLEYDASSPAMAWEDRQVLDADIFQRFGQRAGEMLRPLVDRPLVDEFWPRVINRANATGLIGSAFSQARHQFEADWELNTLELPQSVLCNLPAFHTFFAHILANVDRLREVYNRAIARYRSAHKTRSATHPAPLLEQVDDWTQIPFWMWSTAESQQRPQALFAAYRDNFVEVGDRRALERSVPDPRRDQLETLQSLSHLEGSGVRLRTKALMTTLFARVFLGDLFVHGLGGAKYDEVTDEIIREFYGVDPPHYAIATGTLRLPIDRPAVSIGDLNLSAQTQWSLLHHPESFVHESTCSDNVRQLIADKRRWVAKPIELGNERERCQAIRRINESLQSSVDEVRQRALMEKRQLEQRWRNEQLLGWREYPFAWYPRKTLENFLLAIRHRTL